MQVHNVQTNSPSFTALKMIKADNFNYSLVQKGMIKAVTDDFKSLSTCGDIFSIINKKNNVNIIISPQQKGIRIDLVDGGLIPLDTDNKPISTVVPNIHSTAKKLSKFMEKVLQYSKDTVQQHKIFAKTISQKQQAKKFGLDLPQENTETLIS